MASVQKRPNGKWRARYRDPAGREHARHFDRKRDAQQWLDAVAGDLVRGVHVDPRAGQRTFGSFAGEWLAAQTFDVSTREAVESRLRVHVLPTFGPMRLAAIRPSTVQAWVKGRADQLAASTVRVLLANLSAILGAAVEDGLLVRNPCSSRSVRAPSEERERIVPWSTERVQAVIDAHPDRWRAAPIVAAGCGLRQGEVFGLTVENVQFLRRSMRVAQQVKIVGGRPVFALPKGGKVREVPLASSVATELAEHLRQHPAVEVTLPWGSPNGEPVTSELVFVTRQRGRWCVRTTTGACGNRRSMPPASSGPGRTGCTR